jgi:hypothetical protein
MVDLAEEVPGDFYWMFLFTLTELVGCVCVCGEESAEDDMMVRMDR